MLGCPGTPSRDSELFTFPLLVQVDPHPLSIVQIPTHISFLLFRAFGDAWKLRLPDSLFEWTSSWPLPSPTTRQKARRTNTSQKSGELFAHILLLPFSRIIPPIHYSITPKPRSSHPIAFLKRNPNDHPHHDTHHHPPNNPPPRCPIVIRRSTRTPPSRRCHSSTGRRSLHRAPRCSRAGTIVVPGPVAGINGVARLGHGDERGDA